jgi:hypothetical protein
MKTLLFIIVVAAFALILPWAHSQWKELPSTGSPTEHLPDRTTLAGQSGAGPLLDAKLVDREKNAKEGRAIVKVQTAGVRLVDPAQTQGQPKIDEAHIQYRLDDGPVQNSTSETWIVDKLSPGDHQIFVVLATSDNLRLGKGKRLHIHIP